MSRAAQRLADHRQMSEVTIRAIAPPASPTEKDSEAVSMRHVADLLGSEAFA